MIRVKRAKTRDAGPLLADSLFGVDPRNRSRECLLQRRKGDFSDLSMGQIRRHGLRPLERDPGKKRSLPFGCRFRSGPVCLYLRERKVASVLTDFETMGLSHQRISASQASSHGLVKQSVELSLCASGHWKSLMSIMRQVHLRTTGPAAMDDLDRFLVGGRRLQMSTLKFINQVSRCNQQAMG